MGTIEQITKLIDAGYTKDEIVALFTQSGQQTDDTAKNTDQSDKAADPAPSPTEPDRLDMAISKIEKLAEGVAKIAIMNSQQPPKQSTDDFLATIINPKFGKEN